MENPIETENTPVENILKNIPDYKLDFEHYLLKHSIAENKKGLARTQWMKSIKKASEDGLYETLIMSGEMEATYVESTLTECGIVVNEDIRKAAAEEYKAIKNDLRSIQIRGEEVKKVYTKQDVMDTVAGLKVLVETQTGVEKSNTLSTIEGLEIMLETMPDIMETKGYLLYKDGNVVQEIFV